MSGGRNIRSIQACQACASCVAVQTVGALHDLGAHPYSLAARAGRLDLK